MVDGCEFVWLDDFVVGIYGVGGGVLFNYVDDFFVFCYDDGMCGEQWVFGSIVIVDLFGYYNMKFFCVGIVLPFQVFVVSGLEDYMLEGLMTLGDFWFDVKVELFEWVNGLFGVGVVVCGLILIGNEEVWVG